MSTSSEVKVALDQLAVKISTQRSAVLKVVNDAKAASAALASLPTDYAAIITSVNAYGTTDAFEANAKATLAKMTTEFSALKAVADAIGAAVV